MHGVGSRLFRRLAAAHGLEVSPVVAQDAPDGRFPTVTSPNPEEPAALALALAQAEAEGSELVLVHDPDADRLAAAVPHGGELVVLTGDQIGVLLADHVLAAPDPDAVVLSTVVSSRMVERLAGARGAESLRTRTGFKWMARAAAALAPPRRAVLAYEQALGYSVGDVVRDKDGLGAGLVLAEAAARQRARGRTLVDRWAELEDELGAFRTAAHAVTWAPGEEARARAAFAHARAAPPLRVPGLEAPVRVDYGDPGAIQDGGPPFELFVETFPDGSWWGLRPSGTEPKLKVYVEAREPPGPGAGERAAARADAIRRAARARLEEHAP
jgi:phosphomannomutase